MENLEVTNVLEVKLPDGRAIVAYTNEDSEYPGICIYLREADDTEELMCFAEYDHGKYRTVAFDGISNDVHSTIEYHTEDVQTEEDGCGEDEVLHDDSRV